jgi:hypothetical protein
MDNGQIICQKLLNRAFRNSEGVKQALKMLHDTHMLSWPKIAKNAKNSKIPAGTLCSIYHGMRVPKKWRPEFDMPKLREMPICDKCDRPMGENHKCGIKRPPRIAIRLDDPESAARSIWRHMEPELIADLINLLEHG